MNRLVGHSALAMIAVAACTSRPKTPATHAAPDRATVPLVVEGHRPFVELTLRGGNGVTRRARFLVDSGGGGFQLVEPLARELGLALGDVSEEEGARFAQIKTPITAFVGELPLELDAERTIVLVGRDSVLPAKIGQHADGVLPGHVLARYHVVLDYPHHLFTIARAGALRPEGAAFAMPVNAQSGFPRTEIEVDGHTYGMLLDTGASFTMVSETVLGAWGSAHADWPRYTGAHGEAATLGGQTLETMYLPTVRWAGQPLVNVGVTSQSAGVFEQWMSGMTAAPIVGSLAGNVLERFRLDLDYPSQQLHLAVQH